MRQVVVALLAAMLVITGGTSRAIAMGEVVNPSRGAIPADLVGSWRQVYRDSMVVSVATLSFTADGSYTAASDITAVSTDGLARARQETTGTATVVGDMLTLTPTVATDTSECTGSTGWAQRALTPEHKRWQLTLEADRGPQLHFTGETVPFDQVHTSQH